MRGRASIKIAKRVLNSKGLEVVEESVRIEVGGFEVGEVDLLARSSQGELYAVEVKAGRASPADVKLLFANAHLLNAKPMLVARAFSQEAGALAERLGIELVELSDLLAFEEEELYLAIKGAVEDAILNLLSGLKALSSEEAVRILEAIAESKSLTEAARTLGVGESELLRQIGELRRQGFLPPLTGLKQMKLYAEALTSLKKIIEKEED